MTRPARHRDHMSIHARLAQLGRRRRRLSLVTAALATGAIMCMLIAAITVVAGFWRDQPPLAVRWALLIVTVTTVVVTLVVGPLRALLRRPSAAANARFAERGIDGLNNGLINAVLLDGDRRAPPAMVAAAADETAATIEGVDLASTVSLRKLHITGWAAVTAAMVLAAVCVLQWPRVTRAMTAVFRPGAYVPTIGSVEFVSVRPGDTTVYRGRSTTIAATIRNADRTPHQAEVLIHTGAGQPPHRRAMLVSADHTTYTLPVGELSDEIRYAVRIGDTRAPTDRRWYTITVIDAPGVETINATVTYPPYMRREAETLSDIAGPLQTPVGAHIDLVVRLQHPAARAWLRRAEGESVEMAASDDGRGFTGRLTVSADSGYAIWLADSTGRVVQRIPDPASGDPWFAIAATADRPPTAAFVSPTADVTAAAGDRVPVRVRADDDYGLTHIALHFGRDRDTAAEVMAVQPDDEPAHQAVSHTLTIPADAPTGSVLICFADATDNRRWGELEPQTAAGANVCRIRVQPRGRIDAQRSDQRAELMLRLRELLDLQIQASLATRLARANAAQPGAFTRHAAAAVTHQANVGDRTERLIEEFSFDAATATVQTVLTELSTNEMALARRQAAAWATAADPTSRTDGAAALERTQDRIIDALQMLMAYLPSMSAAGDAREATTGDDLTAYGDRLKELAAAMEQFGDEQARVIDAAERLGKQSVDDFTGDELDLLAELRATEDNWNTFINEAFTDFSKLFGQDFANPSLLAELLSIRTDVTMARGALSAEAVEIATATDSMSGAAENAAELVTHIEKWLPDTPDRQQWTMEDPGGHDNLQMPELPSELEDLVGDLLEQQEDLFEQMQDVTSQAAGSFDEGVGWAAMDGPISSMNAQGVTGNMLPNNSEIAGRSGEGRQGRSSGEFVQDTFVGKGGRDTPTRLTGEPFMTGKVNDTSTMPPGGATGGGKIGGAAGEGLEGPVPPELTQQMQRLAGRQAHLVNRAERIATAFTVGDYSHFRMQQAVVLMSRVGGDLAHGRYRNALRQRGPVLQALRVSHAGAADPVRVLRDVTDAVPKRVRRDIQQARQSRFPPEYESILQSYLHKLAGER